MSRGLSHESDELFHIAGLPPIPRSEFVQQHKWLFKLPRGWIASAAEPLQQIQKPHLIDHLESRMLCLGQLEAGRRHCPPSLVGRLTAALLRPPTTSIQAQATPESVIN